VRSAGDVGDGGVAASRGCFVEERVGPGQPRWVGGTATMGGGEGLTSFFFWCVWAACRPSSRKYFSYALTVDAPVKHTPKNGKAQVSTTTCHEADVVMGKAVDLAAAELVLVDADAVAASTTHMEKQTLHAPCSELSAPPSMSKTCLSTPTLSLTQC